MPFITGGEMATAGNWLDTQERRQRLWGWTDKQVAALWFALGLELEERNVSVQQELFGQD